MELRTASYSSISARSPLKCRPGSLSTLRMQVDKSKAVPGSGKSSAAYKTALRDTAIAVSLASAFGVGIWNFLGADKALEYFTGYLLEESLSVDNLFVFLLLFEYFKVPQYQQKKVLSYGIWGAVVMRAAFISAGLVAIQQFRGVLLVFAGLLMYSSFKMLSGGEEEEENADVSENSIVKFASKLVQATPEYDGDKFFTIVDGVKKATPLFLVLLCVEFSDVMFAVDSIPAVFGVTEDPLIVLTSNIFAIMSLRALYQVLAQLAKDLKYLETAVGAVLGFVGLKLVGEYFGFELPEQASLSVVIGLLTAGVGASIYEKRQTFKLLDLDNDGFLTKEELEASGLDVEEVLSQVDMDMDGKISMKEFMDEYKA
uniref:EF-hand domain-containing protein n=1 Tax=Hanusia phi TaxID=3032 RepID=A0A7S0HY79_9CRYP